ncbi:radical SAM protein [Candidatus Micrarchaeota archaeon]|nr:radical SAM protein [Candidatus Micrarchaeota archaeon]
MIDRDKHPCFNIAAKGSCARVHLPVAPKCNIKCNYCNRKYDCVNESRPGVTSSVLEPAQALTYLREVVARLPETTVAGIAGPGDAFAEPIKTLETLELIREEFPEMILCLATNGLNAADYVDELARLDVSHVTITVNCVDPEIGAKIYAWVRHGKFVLRKKRAAEILLEQQLKTIELLKSRGIIVKANTIVIPGVNDKDLEAVSLKMARMGVDIQNLMPIYPNDGTPFEDIASPSDEFMGSVRAKAENTISQMTHCTRCRADAVGLLESDRSAEFHGCMQSCAERPVDDDPRKPYVAVATMEGILVNQHLGEAPRFQIWEKNSQGFNMIEERTAPEPGGGDARWRELTKILQDCRAVLVSGIGEKPRKMLSEKNILPVEMDGYIHRGLEAVYNGIDLSGLKARRKAPGQLNGCLGGGTGCG